MPETHEEIINRQLDVIAERLEHLYKSAGWRDCARRDDARRVAEDLVTSWCHLRRNALLFSKEFHWVYAWAVRRIDGFERRSNALDDETQAVLERLIGAELLRPASGTRAVMVA